MINQREQLNWWGYKHANGEYQVKRYFDHADIREAMRSPFVVKTGGPFVAKDRSDALCKIVEIIENNSTGKFKHIYP